GVRTPRLRRPPWCHSSTTPPRPSHPAPNVRDDRDTSLLWGETAESVEVICPTGQAKYFLREGWTRILQNCPSGKSVDPSAAVAFATLSAKHLARHQSFSVYFLRNSAAILSAISCAFLVRFGAVTTVGRQPRMGSLRTETKTPPITR